jgi:hypothetical protein
MTDNDEHHKKARNSIRFNAESDSNETDTSDWQSVKHSDPRISTARGIMRVANEEHEWKALDSIRVSFELDSNEMDESDLQPQKHSNPMA